MSGYLMPSARSAGEMADKATYLVDNLLSRVPVRQWVQSFTIPRCWHYAHACI